MKETILVMFSGGVDSTFMLYHYLENTDFNIHVHHISLRIPSEPRWEEEDLASRRVVEYCRNIRSFDYTESRFDMGLHKFVGRDSDTQLLVAAKVAPNLTGKVHVALGWQNSDFQSAVNIKRAKEGITQKLWEALCNSIDLPYGQNVSRKLLFPLIDMKLDKKKMLVILPRELLLLTWSCRRPVKDAQGVSRPCGTCHPCTDIKEALAL